jgi:hypothetical protein
MVLSGDLVKLLFAQGVKVILLVLGFAGVLLSGGLWGLELMKMLLKVTGKLLELPVGTMSRFRNLQR